MRTEKIDLFVLGRWSRSIKRTPNINIMLRELYWVIHSFFNSYHENGGVYEGERNDCGERHGQGTLYYGNASIAYQGEWRNDKAHGRGVLYYMSGNKAYDGDWNAGDRSGDGTVFYDSPHNQKAYEGQWKDDMWDGLGSAYNKNGTIQHRGWWHKATWQSDIKI
jgi:antitoxin component YwqK of YwqJK toxin-antitoxin module